jgi:peptidoglycan/xylan/chitin deacetylase (PgdA/CDA1 family)
VNDDEPQPRGGFSRRWLLRGAGIAAGGTAVVGATEVLSRTTGTLGLSAAQPKAETEFPAIGPVWPDARLREARLLWRARTDQKLVALTFDDGPVPDYTAAVLDALDRLHVRATFNLVGRRVLEHRELVRHEVDSGHEHGNHTWSHVDLGKAKPKVIREQLARAHEVITTVAGTPPRTLRPPYGHVSGDTLVAAAELGYDVISWSVKFHEDLYDAAGNADYIAKNVGPGSVILAHDTGNTSRLKDVQALPRLVGHLRDAGYEFVTVSELLARSTAAG